ncbi:hypothetical protein BJ741DRAFT_605431 [Chytriomyces cf. hyalinus JEL632]|nr:hypothetical protein BJ741DRAFT_605431 [Chytriomyces cf. hyalinus JEL632]
MATNGAVSSVHFLNFSRFCVCSTGCWFFFVWTFSTILLGEPTCETELIFQYNIIPMALRAGSRYLYISSRREASGCSIQQSLQPVGIDFKTRISHKKVL